LQRAREFFRDRSFARAANRQVSDADNKATERAFAQNSFPVKIQTQLDKPLVNEGQRVKNSAQDRRTKSATTLKDNIDAKLF